MAADVLYRPGDRLCMPRYWLKSMLACRGEMRKGRVCKFQYLSSYTPSSNAGSGNSALMCWWQQLHCGGCR